ncbi:MAG TPA: IclR family transcriptional regulator C-terminal domain-containing protein [Methanomicrobiales archaeon]|nr:IclR family transcriptional regulator C-terminal domain-containing protein [Methanomicrobiales archaeon]
MFLFKVKGREAVRLDTYEGMRVHLHTTALGKSILAHLPEERMEEILDERGLPSVTPNTITNREELLSDLDLVRERGYAIDDEERLEGIRCIAAPIVTEGDNVLGAVSISGPRNRLRGERFREEIPSQVLGTSNIISVNVRHM